MAAANEHLGIQAKLVLRRIVAMIPLSLPVSRTPYSSNAQDATEEHSQGEFNLCSNWNRSTLPHLLKMKVSTLDASHLRRTTKLWLEEDECSDAMLYSVSTEMSGNVLLSAQMSSQRLLMPCVCALTQNLTSCHVKLAPGNGELRRVIANLKFVQKEESSNFENEVEGRENLLLVDMASCTEPSGNNGNEESRGDTDFQAADTGLLDELFGRKGNGQLFLENRFQQGPIYAQGFAGKLVANLSLDKMLDDYRNQNQMHLVRIDKCKAAEMPPLNNATVAIGLVSNFNCTIKLSFEQLPDKHLLTDTQSQLESELLCPVNCSRLCFSSRCQGPKYPYRPI